MESTGALVARSVKDVKRACASLVHDGNVVPRDVSALEKAVARLKERATAIQGTGSLPPGWGREVEEGLLGAAVGIYDIANALRNAHEEENATDSETRKRLGACAGYLGTMIHPTSHEAVAQVALVQAELCLHAAQLFSSPNDNVRGSPDQISLPL